jgi:hypothetical protein
MKQTCENCEKRKTCEPYQESIRARNAGCNFTGFDSGDWAGKDTCFIPDPVKLAARGRANQARRDRNQAMRDLGLTRVKGSLGGVYWE